MYTRTTNINLGQSKVVKNQTATGEEKVPSGGEVWDGFLEEPIPEGRVRLGTGREDAGREDEMGVTEQRYRNQERTMSIQRTSLAGRRIRDGL